MTIEKIVVSYENGGTEVLTNDADTIGRYRKKNYELEAELQKLNAGCKLREMCFSCTQFEKLRRLLAETEAHLKEARKENLDASNRYEILRRTIRELV